MPRVKPLRFVVVGAGIVGRKHVEVLLKQPRVKLVGIADPSPEAAAFAARSGVRHFTDTVAMLDATKPDGAIIATPTSLHREHALACAKRGVHILVEKPIADTVKAARAIVAAAKKAKVSLLVGHQRRHNSIIQKARQIVRSGALGHLTAVTSVWLLQKHDDYYKRAWRRKEGGGPILINLIHDIDDLRFICGEIESVQAVASSAARKFEVEDSAAVVLRFAGGALGTAIVSDAVAAPWNWEMTSGENPAYPRRPGSCYLFAGTKASLSVPAMELWSYPGAKGWFEPLSRKRFAVARSDVFPRQLLHFCRVIRGEESPLASGADATRTLEATLAVKRAARLGRAVRLG